jgi:hypothetical protein
MPPILARESRKGGAAQRLLRGQLTGADNTAAGSWACDDSGPAGRNPEVRQGRPTARRAGRLSRECPQRDEFLHRRSADRRDHASGPFT